MLATDSGDLDRLADALRVDQVVVDRAMGAGEAQESHDRLVELVREVPFPVYVALVEMPDGVAGSRGGAANEALATLLHRRIGGEGLYVVHSDQGGPSVTAFGLGVSSSRLYLSDAANRDLLRDAAGDDVWVPAVVLAEGTVRAAAELVEVAGRDDVVVQDPPTLEPSDVEELAERAVALDARARWRPGAPVTSPTTTAPSVLAPTVVGVLAGAAVALFLGQTLRGWPGAGAGRTSGRTISARRREKGRPARRPVARVTPRAAPRVDLRAEAAAAATALGAFVRRLERAAGDASLDPELHASAVTAREAAERYVGSRAELDVVGLRVLVHAGERDLTRARGRRREVYRACFFQPRHGEATSAAGWQLGQAEVRVPCCRRCAADVADGHEPETLTVSRWGRRVPYYTRDDVWARTGFGALTDTLARDVLMARDVLADGGRS